MNLIAILSALGLEQWHAFRWRPELGAPTILVIHE